jgi:Ca-activated chloride channel family protein
MRKVSYGKFSEEDLGIEMEDLLRALSDYFLQSGFQDPYFQATEYNQHTLEELKRAIEQALQSGELFDSDQLEAMQERLGQMSEEQREQLVNRLIEKLEGAGLIDREGQPPDAPSTGGKDGIDGQVELRSS